MSPNVAWMGLIFILIILVFVAAILITWTLSREFNQMKTKIEQLEKAQQKRMPYKAVNGIEDAIAVIMDADRMTDEAFSMISFQKQRTHKASEILKVLRADPYEYNDEAPAGLRNSK